MSAPGPQTGTSPLATAAASRKALLRLLGFHRGVRAASLLAAGAAWAARAPQVPDVLAQWSAAVLAAAMLALPARAMVDALDSREPFTEHRHGLLWWRGRLLTVTASVVVLCQAARLGAGLGLEDGPSPVTVAAATGLAMLVTGLGLWGDQRAAASVRATLSVGSRSVEMQAAEQLEDADAARVAAWCDEQRATWADPLGLDPVVSLPEGVRGTWTPQA